MGERKFAIAAAMPVATYALMAALAALAAAWMLASCGGSATLNVQGGSAVQTSAQGAGASGGGDVATTVAEGEPATTDPKTTLGPGVGVRYSNPQNGADIALEVTGCPEYGSRLPYVYGKLAKGDGADYEIITLIEVNGFLYGKKPFNESPNGHFDVGNEFRVQFQSNDGKGSDWAASTIYLCVIPTGYEDGIEPDAGNGYVVPTDQFNRLKKDSAIVAQIDRAVVAEK